MVFDPCRLRHLLRGHDMRSGNSPAEIRNDCLRRLSWKMKSFRGTRQPEPEVITATATSGTFPLQESRKSFPRSETFLTGTPGIGNSSGRPRRENKAFTGHSTSSSHDRRPTLAFFRQCLKTPARHCLKQPENDVSWKRLNMPDPVKNIKICPRYTQCLDWSKE